MEITIYQNHREKLIALWKRFETKGYRMFVPGHIFMSLEELENQEHVTKKGFLNIGGGVSDRTPRLITPSVLMQLIKKLDSETAIGFVYPEDAIEIYEDIGTYLNLWMDIAISADMRIPAVAELYQLEDLMVWLFNIYKPLMMTRRYIEQKELSRKLKRVDTVMESWLALSVGMDEGTGKPEFISILDGRLPARFKNHYDQQQTRSKSPHVSADLDWLFKSDLG